MWARPISALLVRCGRWLALNRRRVYEMAILPDLRRREKDAQVRRAEIQPFLDVAKAATRLIKDPQRQQSVVTEMLAEASKAARRDEHDPVITVRLPSQAVRAPESAVGALPAAGNRDSVED